MSKKRIIISAGGTGGHLFPAQVLAEELSSSYELLFAAFGLKTSRFFDSEKYPFKEIQSSSLSLKDFRKLFLGPWKIQKGMLESAKVIEDFKPDLVVGFGSYHTFPVLAAASLKKIPFVLHEQNAIPGKVNRLFSSFAKMTAFTFPMTPQFLKGPSVCVKYPLRRYQKVDKKWARSYFGLEEDIPTLLIFGGSQGAKALNTLVAKTLEKMPFKIQILHFTGYEETIPFLEEAYKKIGIQHVVKTFEMHVDYAWQAADAAIVRAGAGTVAELIAFEMPAILIPFPFATENHQHFNGLFFENTVKGGKSLAEKTLTPDQLKEKIVEVIENKSDFIREICNYKAKETLVNLPHIIHEILKN